ncbi:MAG TPA: ComF family protein [Clostridia bacterium]|nr:ComF family protein [Clostridia bacterium]
MSRYECQLGEARCNDCGREQPTFVRAASYGPYAGGLRELVHLLKYDRVRPAAGVLGRMLAETIATLEAEFPADVLVIPVPLHASKLRQRGFNQSELIAEAALRHLERQSRIRYRRNLSALVRKRATESQVGMTREQRRANMRGAFAVGSLNDIANSALLLVDDVFTTGATVGECARVLRKAGAADVWVVTVGRALRDAGTFANVPRAGIQEEEGEAALVAHAP